MKKQFTILAILALAVFMTACGGSEQDTAPEVPPAPEVPQEPTETDSEDTGSSDEEQAEPSEPATGENTKVLEREKLGAGAAPTHASKLEDVKCDLEESKVTFSFTNNGEYTWSLDQEIGFAPSGDVRNVKVFMNHRYEMNANGRTDYHPITREPMFGPNELFSENCGGVTELAVGETATCTLTPVPLNSGTGSAGLSAVNYILIDSPGDDDLIEFTC